MKTGVIILGHGSRGANENVEVPFILQRVADGAGPSLSDQVEVVWAALQFNRPNLEEAVGSLVVRGAKRVLVMPYFLFHGRHISEDIPKQIEELKLLHTHVEFMVSDILGFNQHLVEDVISKILEAAPDLAPESTSEIR